VVIDLSANSDFVPHLFRPIAMLTPRLGWLNCVLQNLDGFARFVLVYAARGWIVPISLVFLVMQALSGFMVFLPTNALILERVHERDLSNMQCVANDFSA
jgi:uncharacterized membrane protein YhaH (DUF805 family)